MWAVPIYLDLLADLPASENPEGRLISLSNGEITDAILEGFTNYLRRAPALPTVDEIISDWSANKISHKHALVAISVFHSVLLGEVVPHQALPSCIAAVLTSMAFEKTVPDFYGTTFDWLCDQIVEHSEIAGPIIESVWVSGAQGKAERLREFERLRKIERISTSLTPIIKNVLGKASYDHITVSALVGHLVGQDQNTIRAVGPEYVSQSIPAAIKSIWISALFVVDPTQHLHLWRGLVQASEEELLSAYSLLSGDRLSGQAALPLVAMQREEVVVVLGPHFSAASSPSSGFRGAHTSWDVSRFLALQIQELASDPADDSGNALARLAANPQLSSYRDLIQHHHVQRTNRLRQSTFAFASAQEVAAAIDNKAPATALDLLAYVVDHIESLARELRATQTDRFHIFWNQDSSKGLLRPKHEEECSAVLADALQARVQPYGMRVVVEHHMVDDKECDLVVLQGIDRLLPIEVKHHYNSDLWTGWRDQLDNLYARDASAGGLGIYMVLWSGEDKGRKLKYPPAGGTRPTNAQELLRALEGVIPSDDRSRLRVIVVDIAPP